MPDENPKPPDPNDEENERPDNEKRGDKNKSPKPTNGDTGLGDQSADEMLSSIRRNDFLSGLFSERDVSLVYIDRHRVQNFFGPEGGPGRPRPTDAAPSQPQRLRDLVVNPIAAAAVEQLQRLYVEPALFPIAQERFRQAGFLILCGPRQTGKRAAALRLLSQITGVDGAALPLYELNPDQKLVDLRPGDLPTGAGLLLESPSGEALAGISAFQLTGLRGELSPHNKNNGLVIVTERLPTTFPRGERGLVLDWSLAWPGNPTDARRTLLEKHLREFSQGEPDLVDALDTALERLLGEERLTIRLGENLGPGEVADLALLLLPVLQGKQGLDEALARFGVQVQREVGDWFATGSHDLELKILMVAAAVFNGALVEEVEAAEKELLGRVYPPTPKKEEEPPAFDDPFAPRFSRRSRLDAIHAELRDTPIPGTHYGDTSARALVLRNDAWQRAVLYHIWEDVTPLREPLLAWLSKYSVSNSPRMRERAAAAVGALARHSFPHIEAGLLREWAKSPFEAYRRSAAQVLGITIWDEGQSAATSRLLHHWATMTGNVRFQWTAAVAYAGLAGLRYPQQALADLQRVALNTLHEPLLLPPIFQSFLTQFLLADREPGRRLALLQELVNWAQYRESEAKDRTERLRMERAIRRTGLLAFDVLLLPERKDPVWRMIVTDAGAPGQAQTLTTDLLLAALQFRQPADSVNDRMHPRKIALDNLHRLLATVRKEEDEELYHHLEGLLKSLVARCRQTAADTLEMLRYHAAFWDDARPSGSDLVDILLAE